MRNNNGWIKIDRSFDDSAALNTACRRSVWLALLMMANFEDSTRPVSLGGKPYCLKRGQILTTLREIAEIAKVSPEGCRKILEHFKNWQMCQDIATSGQEIDDVSTFISITNYDKYQCQLTTSGQEVDKKLTTSGQEVDKKLTIKEDKKIRIEELKNDESKNHHPQMSRLLKLQTKKDALKVEVLKMPCNNGKDLMAIYRRILMVLKVDSAVFDSTLNETAYYYADQIIIKKTVDATIIVSQLFDYCFDKWICLLDDDYTLRKLTDKRHIYLTNFYNFLVQSKNVEPIVKGGDKREWTDEDRSNWLDEEIRKQQIK